LPRPPRTTLFPYTTLFRSQLVRRRVMSRRRDRLAERGRVELRDHGVGNLNDRGQLRLLRLDQLRVNPQRPPVGIAVAPVLLAAQDRKSTRLNSSHVKISYA